MNSFNNRRSKVLLGTNHLVKVYVLLSEKVHFYKFIWSINRKNKTWINKQKVIPVQHVHRRVYLRCTCRSRRLLESPKMPKWAANYSKVGNWKEMTHYLPHKKGEERNGTRNKCQLRMYLQRTNAFGGSWTGHRGLA